MSSRMTRNLVLRQANVVCYKAFKVLFVGYEQIMSACNLCQSHSPLNETNKYKSADFTSTINSIASSCAKCLKQIYELPAKLRPMQHQSAFNYSLMDWNQFNVDAEGNNLYPTQPLEDETMSRLANVSSYGKPKQYGKDWLPLTTQEAYNRLVWYLKDDYGHIPNFHNIVLQEAMAIAFEPSSFPGFHCHKTISQCFQHQFSKTFTTEVIASSFYTILARVQLRGRVIEGDMGYIGEEMKILALFSPLDPIIRQRWEAALNYPIIEDLEAFAQGDPPMNLEASFAQEKEADPFKQDREKLIEKVRYMYGH